MYPKLWTVHRLSMMMKDSSFFFLVRPTDEYVLRCWLNRLLSLGRSRRRILNACVVSKATSRTTPPRNLLRLQWNLFKIISDSTRKFFILQECTQDMHKSSVHWVIDGGSFFGGRVVLTGIVHIVFSVAPIAESQQRVISLKNVPGKVQKSWFYRVIDEDFFFASDIRPALIS